MTDGGIIGEYTIRATVTAVVVGIVAVLHETGIVSGVVVVGTIVHWISKVRYQWVVQLC